MAVPNPVEKRYQDVKPCSKCLLELAEALDNEGALLGHDDGGLRDDDQDENRQND